MHGKVPVLGVELRYLSKQIHVAIICHICKPANAANNKRILAQTNKQTNKRIHVIFRLVYYKLDSSRSSDVYIFPPLLIARVLRAYQRLTYGVVAYPFQSLLIKVFKSNAFALPSCSKNMFCQNDIQQQSRCTVSRRLTGHSQVYTPSLGEKKEQKGGREKGGVVGITS